MMAEFIKKLFGEKIADVKFKLAGPGHKLSDASVSQSSSSKEEVPVNRSGLSEESRVAAEAALARLQHKRENPAFNTSRAAIQAQVKRELQNEIAAASSQEQPSTSETSEERVEVEKASNYAVAGVFFRCPMISNDVTLPHEEWKKYIKSFLYEQLEEERGLTACLIIQSCNHNREKIDMCVEILCTYLENILNYPEEEKFKKIRMSNRTFCDRIQPIEGAMELLLAAGFTQQKLSNVDGAEEDFLVFSAHNTNTVEHLAALIETLISATSIQLELDRDMKVLQPSQAAVKIKLPSCFYVLPPEKMKREQELMTEAIEKSQMLRTKAMREKDELREMRKYKFAVVRIRFPDGILLQGTFSIYERYSEIYKFVEENLEHSGLPFTLNAPTGHKLVLEEDSNKTLVELRLVPTAILNFAWHPEVLEEINCKLNKDVYLKPEVMLLHED